MEREIARNTTLELSYVGSKGSQLLFPYDANQVPAGDINGNGVPDRLDFIHAGSDTGGAGRAAPLRGLRQRRASRSGTTAAASIYHSLQTQLVSRFGHGSQFQASYTFSRTIGDVPLDAAARTASEARSVSLLENRGLDRGLTQTHRKHIFNASLVLVLPELRGQVGLREERARATGRSGPSSQAASGAPITVYTGEPSPASADGVVGHRLHRQPAAERRAGPALPRDRRARGADPEPGRLDAHRLPARHVRQLRPRRLRRARLRPGGPVALQEHQAQPAGEGPAPVRGVQRLQPRQLHRASTPA